MPTEKRVIFQAGRLWYAKQYLPLRGAAPSSQRRERRDYSTQIRNVINFRTSKEKLWLLLECNFRPDDLYVSVSYRDENLPKTKDRAERNLTWFIRALRAERAAKGQDLVYIRVTEGLHGDHRLHHHLIINATGDDYKTIRRLWSKFGDSVKIYPYKCKSPYEHAEYLTKEPKEKGRRRVGERMWRISRNAKRPVVTTVDVPQGEELLVPHGYDETESRNKDNTFGRFQYKAAILKPDAENPNLGQCIIIGKV